MHSMNFGLNFSRNMSTGAVVGDSAAAVVIDTVSTAAEAMSTASAPVMSEVEVAAADSFFPEAALQYMIDYIHTLTGLNWWGAIVVSTLVIRLATSPLVINQMKATSKCTARIKAIKEEMDSMLCSSSKHVCKPAYCNNKYTDPEIRFPFRLIGVHKENCGYPSFDLSCNAKSKTILTLPGSGDFLVNRIDYTAPAIYLDVDDPHYCLPERLANFSLNGSPFSAPTGKNYRFYSCSGVYTKSLTNKAVPLSCLSTSKYMFLATAFKLRPEELPANCKTIENLSVPLELSHEQYMPPTLLSAEIELIWNEPKCQECEIERLHCGFINNSGLDVACYSASKTGLSTGAKYGVAVCVGILMCVIGAACYLCSKLSSFDIRRNNPNSDIFPVGALQSAPSTAITGLDMKTIESYPKLTLGESRRFPNKISDSSCSICLCEYQAKETLRSIPECNHCFHAACIDEWLKLNATCPVCRNTPESIVMTPLSSSTASSIHSSSPV